MPSGHSDRYAIFYCKSHNAEILQDKVGEEVTAAECNEGDDQVFKFNGSNV